MPIRRLNQLPDTPTDPGGEEWPDCLTVEQIDHALDRKNRAPGMASLLTEWRKLDDTLADQVLDAEPLSDVAHAEWAAKRYAPAREALNQWAVSICRLIPTKES